MKDIDLWAAEKCKDALRHCRDLAEIYPPDRGVLAGLHEGMEIIREVLQKIPDHREALNIAYRIHLELGWFDYAKAINYTLNKEDTLTDPYYCANLCLMFEILDIPSYAKTCYRLAIDAGYNLQKLDNEIKYFRQYKIQEDYIDELKDHAILQVETTEMRDIDFFGPSFVEAFEVEQAIIRFGYKQKLAGNLDYAYSIFLGMRKAHEQNIHGWEGQAAISIDIGKYDQALSIINEAKKIFPWDRSDHFVLNLQRLECQAKKMKQEAENNKE